MPKISKIEYIGEEEQQCISVSAKDHLYITDDEIITHNTILQGTMSELAFFRESGKSDEFIMRIFNDLKSRVESRMRGNYFGRTILDSSPNTLESPIDDYVVNHAHKDPTNFIIQGARWDKKYALPGEFDMSKTFFINKGAKGQPPFIIEDEKILEKIKKTTPERLLEVPVQLRQYFIDDIYKALKDHAGIPAGSADNLIYDYSKIESIFRYPFKSIITHIKAPLKSPPEGLIWNQIQPIFFKKIADKYEFYYKPYLPRVFAVDQSLASDATAIAVMHVEKERGIDSTFYIIDMLIVLTPSGDRISLDAIKLFLEDLRNKGNMVITHGAFDQFQSEASIQYLQKKKFNIEKISVDRTVDPYLYLLSLMETKHLLGGKNLHLKNNIKSLKFVKTPKSKKTKIDHDSSQAGIFEGTTNWETSLIGMYAKDASDSVCSATELLRKYHNNPTELFDENYLYKIISPEHELQEAENNIKFIANTLGFKI